MAVQEVGGAAGEGEGQELASLLWVERVLGSWEEMEEEACLQLVQVLHLSVGPAEVAPIRRGREQVFQLLGVEGEAYRPVWACLEPQASVPMEGVNRC